MLVTVVCVERLLFHVSYTAVYPMSYLTQTKKTHQKQPSLPLSPDPNPCHFRDLSVAVLFSLSDLHRAAVFGVHVVEASALLCVPRPVGGSVGFRGPVRCVRCVLRPLQRPVGTMKWLMRHSKWFMDHSASWTPRLPRPF